MLNWLRRIDDVVFAPPHKFETILAFVALRLGLAFEDESEERPNQRVPSTEEKPNQTRS